MGRKKTESLWQKEALRLRLGGSTYQEIAKIVGVSRQRVQQVLCPPPIIRNMIVTKAEGRCENCDVLVGQSGHVHHVGVTGDILDTYNEIENLQLLCISCHMSLHSYDNPGKQATAKAEQGHTCDVSLAPIDIGFDPREQGMACAVPADATRVGYDRDGEARIVTGTISEIAAELREAGYEIVISPRSENPAAALGRLGGKVKSRAKTAAARRNALKGGRPRKGKS